MQTITTFCGIDVSAKKLVSRRCRGGKEEESAFGNDQDGHRALLKWVGKGSRVCLEATGIYHLQLALMLVAAGVEVMVVNPRVAKDFGRALANRSKTDKVDARTLLEYVCRMDFVAWQAPSAPILELRSLGRRLSELIHLRVVEKNHVHASRSAGVSKKVIHDVEVHIRQIEARVKLIEKAALEVIREDADLLEMFKILTAIKGVGPRSAILLLTELAVLDPKMTTKQIVAYAGLDPREYESGDSVQRPTRISKVGNSRVRAILYMIGLTASRSDRGSKAFYQSLVRRGKNRMQALVALMRKLLHGIWIVLQRRMRFASSVLFAASLAQAESPDSAIRATQPELGQGHPSGRSEAKELREQLDPGSAEAKPSRKARSKAA
jgi:transposase